MKKPKVFFRICFDWLSTTLDQVCRQGLNKPSDEILPVMGISNASKVVCPDSQDPHLLGQVNLAARVSNLINNQLTSLKKNRRRSIGVCDRAMLAKVVKAVSDDGLMPVIDRAFNFLTRNASSDIF